MNYPLIIVLVLMTVSGNLLSQSLSDHGRKKDTGRKGTQIDSPRSSDLDSDYVTDFIRRRSKKDWNSYSSEHLLNDRTENNYISNLYDAKPSYYTTAVVSLFQSMSAASSVSGEIPEGREIKVLSSLFGHWWKVFYNGKTGYVEPKFLSKEKPLRSTETSSAPATVDWPLYDEESEYLITKETSLRAGPDSKSLILLRFKTGDQVKVLNASGHWWWEVSFKGKRGWAKRQLLQRE